MSLVVQFFCALLVLLAASRLFGELAVRLGQPQLVGELVAGVGLGAIIGAWPDLLPHLVRTSDSEVFEVIVELGAFFLMLYAGLELKPSELAQKSLNASLVAAGGVALYLSTGMLLTWALLPASGDLLNQVLLVGVALAVTDAPTALWVLIDLDKLHTPVGRTIVSAAIFDDVLGLIMLALLTGLMASGDALGWGDGILILGRIAAFFAISVSVGFFVFPYLRKYLDKLRESEHEFSELILAALTYGILAEFLGLHLVLGAFLAGLFFVRKTRSQALCDTVKCKMSGVTSGFLAPVFFASVGLDVDLSVFAALPIFVPALLVIVLLSKLVGCAIPARLTGLNMVESVSVGTAMAARGVVTLVVAGIGLDAGMFGKAPAMAERIYSAIIIVAVITAIFAPVALRALMKNHGDSGAGSIEGD